MALNYLSTISGSTAFFNTKLSVGSSPYNYPFQVWTNCADNVAGWIVNTSTTGFGLAVRTGTNSTRYALAIQNSGSTSNSIEMFGNGNICMNDGTIIFKNLSSKTSETTALYLNSAGSVISGTSSAGISFSGSTANGIVTYGNATTADVESDLIFDGNSLILNEKNLVFKSVAKCGVLCSTDGEVYLYRDGPTLVLNTTSTPGVCIRGALNVCSSITTPAAIASIIYTCSTGYLHAGTCVTAGSCVFATTRFYGACVCTTACIMAATCICATTLLCAGTCGVAPDWVATSDCRLKCDIEPFTNALPTISQLQGVYYRFRDDKNCELNIGLIAQDVIKVLPEIVSHSIPNEEDAKYDITDDKLGLKYDKLTAVLVEAIKEQQEQINKLKLEVCNLKGNMPLLRNY